MRFRKLKRGSASHIRAMAAGPWTAQDENGNWCVFAYNIDGELEAIATGSPAMARSLPGIYVNTPPR